MLFRISGHDEAQLLDPGQIQERARFKEALERLPLTFVPA